MGFKKQGSVLYKKTKQKNGGTKETANSAEKRNFTEPLPCNNGLEISTYYQRNKTVYAALIM